MTTLPGLRDSATHSADETESRHCPHRPKLAAGMPQSTTRVDENLRTKTYHTNIEDQPPDARTRSIHDMFSPPGIANNTRNGRLKMAKRNTADVLDP